MTDMQVQRSAVQDSEPDGAARIASLDILRGVAILGILFMNINSMGATLAGSHSPFPDLIGWTAADQVTWWLRQLFAAGTARGLLELLFGAGMVVLTARIADGRSRWATARRYYWRMAVLAVFGLVHVWVLLWPGDILHIYALSAMIGYPLRRLRPRWLIAIAAAFMIYTTLTSALPLRNAIRENVLVAEAAAARAAGRPVTAAQRKAIKGLDGWHQQVKRMRAAAPVELAKRRSGFAGWQGVMTGEWLRRYSGWRLPIAMYGEAITTILLGIALFRLGILQGARPRGFYARMAIGWYAIGLGIRFVATLFTARMDDTVTLAWALDEVGRVTTTLGHVGLIHWLLAGATGARLLRPFAAAGRTALTIYIAQTLICLWVLYPPFMLGLFGTQGWAELMATALLIDAALLAGATWWVKRYEIAPVEWAWRSIVAGRRLPFGRARGGVGVSSSPIHAGGGGPKG